MAHRAITVRYCGSLPEYFDRIGCADFESGWTGPGTTRYTVRLWGTGDVLRNVRHRSLEFGSVTIFEGARCNCGADHDRSPRKEA